MPEPDAELITCKSCSTTNRVPLRRLEQGLEPVCGSCKSPLPVSKPIHVNDEGFSTLIERSSLPVLVDMWAEWCGPCRFIAPLLDQLAAEMAGRLRIAKVNIDENPITAERFRINSIPALLVFKGGREVDRLIGAQPKSEIVRHLQQWIG